MTRWEAFGQRLIGVAIFAIAFGPMPEIPAWLAAVVRGLAACAAVVNIADARVTR